MLFKKSSRITKNIPISRNKVLVIEDILIILALLGLNIAGPMLAAYLGVRRQPPAMEAASMASSLDPDMEYTGMQVMVNPLEPLVITAATTMQEDFALLLTPQGTLVVRPPVAFEPTPTPAKLESPQLSNEADRATTSTPQSSPLNTLRSTPITQPTVVNMVILTGTPSPTATSTLTPTPTPSPGAYK